MRTITQKLMMFMAALMCSVSMSVSAQVLNEGFEDSSFPPDDWSTIHVRGVVEWTRNTSYKHAGEASAKANYDSSTGHENYLVTPKLTPAAGDTLSFFVAAQQYSATTLSIEVSTTDATAASFTTVLATYTTGSSGTIGTTSTSTWVEKRFPMDDYVGQDIFIAFHITDDNGSAVYIDDVTGVTLHVVTCPKPATIAVSDITNESATLSWAAGGSETQWQYVLTDANAAADWTTATTINQPSVTLTGLTANTAYDFHVRAYCSQAEQSDARLTSFRTTCDAITAFPWSEDFEAMAQNSEIDAPCWSNEHITGNGGYRFRSYSLASTGNNTRMCQLPDMSAGTITDLTLPAMNIPEANAYELILTMYRSANYGSYTNEGLRILALNGSDTAVLAFISRNPTQAYVVDETVIIPSEENVGWYTYNLTIPYSGFTSIVIRGESQYGAATYFDNLIVREKPSCTQPATLTASDVTAHGATLTWTTEGTETQFQYAVMPKDTAVDWTGATTVEVAEEKTAIVTGLTANTAYDIYLRAYCSESDQSEARMVSITTLPSCFVPTMPIISDITTVGATFTWEAGNGETEFQYVVMPKDTVVDWTGATLTNATTLTIAVLSANTAYDFYVRAYCSESDQSEAVKVTFRTECEVLATFPWSEDFEEVATGNIAIPCWKNEHIAGTGTQLFKVTTNSSSGNSTHLGQLPDMYSGTITDLSLPEMNIPAANAYEFIISEYRNATGSSYPEEGLRILALNGTDTFELAFISRNYTQAYMVAETVVIPAETASGWYTYNLAIPCSGNVRIIVRGESKYGSSTYFDNLMVREKPSCTQPTVPEVSDITMAGATFTWAAGNGETQFQYVVMPKDEAVDWTNATLVTATTATVTGLTANTAYDFYVRALCSAIDMSDARKVSFRTACGTEAIPFTEGFEDLPTGSRTADAPTCWALLNANDGAYPYIYVNTSSSYVKTGSQSLYFQSSSSRYGYAILPAMGAPLNTLQISFWHKEQSASNSGLLDLGYMADITDEASFVSIMQFTRSTSWQKEEVMMNNLPAEVASTARLAFRYGGASNNYYMGIDDIVIDVLPNCIKPSNVTVTNITDATAEINCTAGAAETAWTVQYRTSAEENWTIATASTTMPYILPGLIANTAYEVQVAAVCSETENSEWTNAVNFRTACSAYDAATYEEGFEGDGFICWTVGNAQSTSTSYIPSVSTSYKRTGSYGMRLNANSSNDSAYAILPVMDYGTPGLAGYTLNFYARSSSTSASYYKHILVGIVSDPEDISTFELIRDIEVTGAYLDEPYEVILGSYVGTGTRLALLAITDPTVTSGTRYASIYVDDISLTTTPTCIPLAEVKVSERGRRNLIVSLTPKAGVALGTYDLVYSNTELNAAALEAATKTVVSTATYEITGLERETPYYIYVRANCGGGEVSTWVSTSATTKGLLGCDDITVGTGTSAGNNPVTNYDYAYAQLIYIADEIAHTGNISSIQLKRSSYANVMNNMKVYIGTTDKNVFASKSDWVPEEALTLVYQGNFPAGTADAPDLDIPFITPFAYDGTSNIVVAISNGHGNYGSIQNFKYTTATNTLLVRRKDGDASYANHPGTAEGQTLSSDRTNILFSFCYAIEACPSITGLTSELIGDGTSEARISWTASTGDYVSGYEVAIFDYEITDYTSLTGSVVPATTTSYDFSGLNASTQYYAYVRAICMAEEHNDGSSTWVRTDFATNGACPVLKNLEAVFTAPNAVTLSWELAYAEQEPAFRYILSETELDAAGIATATPVDVSTNTLEFNDLAYDQTYYFYVASACDELTSGYISTSFTTKAACQAVENLATTRISHNLVTLTWTSAQFATETQWEVGIVGDEAHAQIVSERSAMIIGLNSETDYTAYVKALCSETSKSVAATVDFTTDVQPASCVTVGTGTASSYYSPMYSYDKNSWVQTIYPATEIGPKGEIQSIAFDVAGIESTKNMAGEVNIYLAHTTKSVNASNSDWIAMEDLTLVYTTSSFEKPTETGWWNIPLQTPFMYNGTDNLALVISAKLPNWTSNLKFKYTSISNACLYRFNNNTTSYGDHPASNTGTLGAYRANAQFCFVTTQTCPDVTSLAINGITGTTASATWEPVGRETSWNVFVSPTQVVDPASITGYTTVNVMSYPMSGLLVDHDYWFYIQPVCTGADSWRVATFQTLATCFPPTDLVASNITGTTATVSWTDENNVGSYTVAYGPSSTFNPKDATTYEIVDATALSAVLTGLQPNTDFSFAVRSNCSDMNSRFGAAATFKTNAGVPMLEEFATTSTPDDWGKYSGLLEDIMSGDATLSTISSGWTFGTKNGVFDSHAIVNLYGTNCKYWLVAPAVEMKAGVQLTFDVALTAWSGDNVPAPAYTGTDDKFVVLISTDDGATWNILREWSNAEDAQYVLNNIANTATGEKVTINLVGYEGQQAKIAFYGESTTSNADNNLHVDNFSLKQLYKLAYTVDGEDYSAQWLTKIAEAPMVPVFYNKDVEVCKNVIKACYEGGVRAFEFTNRGDFAHEVFGELSKWVNKECPELALGIGSVVDAPTASLYIQLGANFVVGPLFNPDIAIVCNRRCVTYCPGCLTPSEIGKAQEVGCDFTKVFPGDVVGPNLIKGLMAPMPWSKIMVTGGVAPEEENLTKWFKAGVFCVGMGSKLFPSDKVKAGDWQYVTDKCKEALGYCAKARA